MHNRNRRRRRSDAVSLEPARHAAPLRVRAPFPARSRRSRGGGGWRQGAGSRSACRRATNTGRRDGRAAHSARRRGGAVAAQLAGDRAQQSIPAAHDGVAADLFADPCELPFRGWAPPASVWRCWTSGLRRRRVCSLSASARSALHPLWALLETPLRSHFTRHTAIHADSSWSLKLPSACRTASRSGQDSSPAGDIGVRPVRCAEGPGFVDIRFARRPSVARSRAGSDRRCDPAL